MTDPLESQSPRSSSPPGSSPPQDEQAMRLYHQGVQAFKQGQYGAALTWFQQLAQVETVHPALMLKGQMGLIRAYQKLGQVDDVRQGCQRMIAAGVPEARRWAEGVLAQLPASPPPAAPTRQPTGSDRASPPSNAVPLSSLGTDPTGFVPLEAPPSAPDLPAQPLPAQNFKAQERHHLEPPADEPEHSSPLATSDTPEDSAAPESPEAGTSLFLYWELNQDEPGQPRSPAETPLPAPATKPAARPARPPQPSTTTGSRRRPQRPWRPPYALWAVQVVVVCITLWVALAGFHGLLRGMNTVVRRGGRFIGLDGFALLERTYTIPILLLLVGLVLASPWWIDSLLTHLYGQRPLTSRQLQGQHPAVLKLLRQQCQKQGWYLPELRLLPDAVPLCFSYGWRPRHLRIVVSQGLLDQCDSDLLGMFYLYELAHMGNRATAVVSALGGFLVVLQAAQRYVATWRQRQSLPALRVMLGALSCLCYGLFWSLRRGLLWISRSRSDWADRRVEYWLHRPDLQRDSLCWMTTQLPAVVGQRGTLPPLWWSLDLLMPVSPQAALSPGSWIAPLGEAIPILPDWANPYRHWLVGGATHKPLGERLHWLNQQAIERQQPALNLAAPIPSPLPSLSMPRLIRQNSPILGLCLGGGLALGFWFVGGLVLRFGWQRLSWWYQDESLLYGGLLLGLGLGLLLRINILYPDVPARAPVADPRLLLGPLDQLPVEGYPCRLSGTLLCPNDLLQTSDFYLLTLGGLIKLHVSSPQPFLWSLRSRPSPLSQWVGRSVTVAGWRRRSNGILWIDVASLELSSQRSPVLITAPIWATVVSLGLCLGGIAIIWLGV